MFQFKLKRTIIKWADWFDDHILVHRFYWVCQIVGGSSWWDEVCETCHVFMQFAGYEYWEEDENDNPIIMGQLVLDDPDLTPESELWNCPKCGQRHCVLIKADGTRA